MIVLDTNVLSELMRSVPNQQVIAWVDAQPASDLVVTSITVAEILYGIARMDDGKRKQALHSLALAMFEEDFAGNVLSFDMGAAEQYAELVSQSEASGRAVGMTDAQIAAICRAHGATLATRNVRDFDRFGISIINPWKS
jgi:predicted nucleic acid-binding protein